MRLADIPAQVVNDLTRKWRRRAIAAGIIAVCALAVVVETVAAIRLAFEPLVGPIGARLVMAGLFALVIALTVTALLVIESNSDKRAETLGGALERNVRSDDRTALIAEAIDLGYSLAQGLGKRRPPAAEPPQETGGADETAGPDEEARPRRRAAAE